jgi:hypothetical protein
MPLILYGYVTDEMPQHTVMYSPGQCAIKAVRDYFTNGTLPEPGTVCEQDFDIFSGKSYRDSFDLKTVSS